MLGEICAVGAAATRRLAGMDLNQGAAVVELHQLGVRAHRQGRSDPLLRQRIQRACDFGMEVAVDFDVPKLQLTSG